MAASAFVLKRIDMLQSKRKKKGDGQETHAKTLLNQMFETPNIEILKAFKEDKVLSIKFDQPQKQQRTNPSLSSFT